MKTIWNLPRIEFIPFPEIEEHRPTLLVTSELAWNAVSGLLLQLPIVWQINVAEATSSHWDLLLSKRGEAVCDPQVVYAVGGGLAVDAAKHIAVRLDLPLLCLPTALSVDAFFTWTSGVREALCVRYVETKPPERLLMDFDVIAKAPDSIRAAGICDVLSIATGCWDWKFAEQRGQNPPGMGFTPWAYENAQAILIGGLDCAEAAGTGEPAGIKQLLDCLSLEVQLCNQLGHARPEEGSEHYFAYAIENYVGKGIPHGNLVGPGILLMAQKQGQETRRLEKALHDCHITLKSIPEETIEKTLHALPDFCRRQGLPYGIAHELDCGA